MKMKITRNIRIMGPNWKQPIRILFNLCMLLLCIINAQAADIDRICPRMLHKIFNGYAPIGNKTAGTYKEFLRASGIEQCAVQCCLQKSECNVAFFFDKKCYHVKCKNDEVCMPLERVNLEFKLKMVLVNPVASDIAWIDLMKLKNIETQYKSIDLLPIDSSELSDHVYPDRMSYNLYPNFMDKLEDRTYGYPRYSNIEPYQQYDSNDLVAEESKDSILRDIQCTINGKPCGENESCMQLDVISVCRCNIGYSRNAFQKCVPDEPNMNYPTNFNEKMKMFNHLANKMSNREDPINREDSIDESKSESAEVDPKVEQLSVSVVSKTVQLPDNKATLSAFTVPDEQTSGVKYNYSWSLISQPGGDVNGTMSDKTKSEISLTNLSEGLYRFKVVVSGRDRRGETYANITVLPEKRYNKAPIAIIKPAQQLIKAPTNSAILDGSASTDDDQIKSWRWDLIQGPINYAPVLTETSTLQLSNLLPGNYTFKLTVMDSDNITNSTTANITVSKATDYPPSANAGQPVILYLPQNNVTLDGSHSTDDHEITAWEWTKDSSDVSKAVDMQDTRTPYLRLSNLEEGIYTFVLKVTDASNQSNTAKVSVFVKRPSNKPPLANAGLNQTISLPQTWVTLNASNTTHDAKINSYEWVQLSGPTNSNVLNKDAMVANATGLTIGLYTFEVHIIDDSNNNASSKVTITVVQEKNSPPVAHAGGDQSITLPQNAIYMNGSQSSDDLGIVKYKWTRDGTSLAIGSIVGNTDSEPVLIITNIVAGRYVFKLTVTDAQGLSSSDTVSCILHPDPLLLNLVEVTFTVGVSALTEAEVSSLQQKLVLLLGNNLKLIVRDLRMDQKTGEAILIFYVEQVTGAKENQVLNGFNVEVMLKEKLWSGSNLVGMPISDIRTTVCQNKCSGHGACNSETRACMCDTFWMPSLYYFWGISEANCDWSILYVVIGVFIIFILISAICWGLTRYCRTSKPRSRTKTQKYALLDSQDNEVPSLNRVASMTESETDSDVLFENQNKPNGVHRLNGSVKNGHKNYAVTRLGRRIKA